MIAALRDLYQTVKAVIFGTTVDGAGTSAGTVAENTSLLTASTVAVTTTAVMPATTPASETEILAPEILNESIPAPAGLEDWSVHPYADPTFEKIGRVYLDAGDLIIRSDRDERVFLLVAEDLDAALTGGTGTVRLLESLTPVGTAHLSTSGLALNLVIDGQLHTVPMRSLVRVLTGANRKAPLFVPAEDLAPDTG